MTTGLFPQELIINLGALTSLEAIHLVTSKVKQLNVQVSETNDFKVIETVDLTEESSGLQSTTVRWSGKAHYLKIVILQGKGHFCSVHKISLT